jgi:Tfp pilus assembly protein PilF
VLWFDCGKLIWPHDLTFIYPRWEIDPRVAWLYVFPVAAMVVVIALWRLRTRMGRGPLVAVLCFAGTLAPALGFFDVFPFRYSYVADHFQYLASIGLITLIVSTGTLVCQRVGPRGGDWGRLVAVTVLLVLGVVTWSQAHIYQDVETLWRDTIAKNPQCWLAHTNLGDVFLQEGKVSDAIGQYEQVLRIKPDYAEAHFNLGIALTQAGQIEEAIAHYEEALRINPDYAEAHSNLGTALIREGKVSEAIAQYEQALRIAPNFANVHNNLGIVLAQTGQIEDAIAHYGQALRINPDYAEAHYNLGNALAQIGQVLESIAQYEQALRIKPDFTQAQNALARLQPRQ